MKNIIYNESNLRTMARMQDSSIDLVVTSPPYDNLREYTGECEWNFDIFKSIASELYRVLKNGCVLVWIVGDATIKGSESMTSFKQALFFNEIGFKLHDTMIFEKNSSSFPARRGSQRYTQIFEYMFVFVKGSIRKDISLIADKPNKWAGHTNWGKKKTIKPVPEFSLRNNIWKYSVGFNDKTGHPAVFPEELAKDHILSWSKEGDLVYDPFMGSGTTAKMAKALGRDFIGSEISEEYYNIAIQRIGNNTLF